MGVVKHYMTINGKSTEDFNVFISGEATFASPTRRYTTVHIPGRNGDLTYDDGDFENVPVSYPAFITRDYQKQISNLEDFLGSLSGYVRIEDTYHPDEFRLGIFKGGITPKNTAANLAGSFEIQFDMKPQRFLKEGENVVTFIEDGVLKSPTFQIAKPLLRVYGTGTVGIGATTIQINQVDEYVDIDCDTEDAFKGAVNCNADIQVTNHTFPTLQGETAIELTGVTRVDITPRWWRA